MFKIILSTILISLIVLLESTKAQVNLNRNNLAQLCGCDPAASNLVQLKLANKSISSIDPNTFVGLKGIKYLELNHNQLTSISAATLNEMPNLLELYLHNNKLTSFDPLSLIQLHSVVCIHYKR